MRIAAFVMDPIDELNLKKDSTLAMIRAAQTRGWDVRYLQQRDLFYRDEQPWGFMRTLALSDAFAQRLDPATAGNDWYRLGDEAAVPLDQCDVILMRKDPPFDMEYIYSTYLLERAERSRRARRQSTRRACATATRSSSRLRFRSAARRWSSPAEPT